MFMFKSSVTALVSARKVFVLLAPSHLLSWRIRREEREEGINQIGLMDPLCLYYPLPSLSLSACSITLLSARPQKKVPDLTVSSGCCFKYVELHVSEVQIVFEKKKKKKRGHMVNCVILSWSCRVCVRVWLNAYLSSAYVSAFSRSSFHTFSLLSKYLTCVAGNEWRWTWMWRLFWQNTSKSSLSHNHSKAFMRFSCPRMSRCLLWKMTKTPLSRNIWAKACNDQTSCVFVVSGPDFNIHLYCFTNTLA